LVFSSADTLQAYCCWWNGPDYQLDTKVGASGSTKCQQFIGGAVPPGSRGPPSKRRMHAGSVGLQFC